MSQAKVNQLDVWNGNILVQQHNVFWLGNKKNEEKGIKEKMVIKALFYVFALGLRWGLVFFFRRPKQHKPFLILVSSVCSCEPKNNHNAEGKTWVLPNLLLTAEPDCGFNPSSVSEWEIPLM